MISSSRLLGALAGLLLASATLVAPAQSAPLAAADSGSNPWWFDGLNLAAAHEQTRGEGVKVAVIDGALNREAADLRGADITFGSASSEDGRPSTAKSYPDALYTEHGTAIMTMLAGQGTGTDGPGIMGVAPRAEYTFYQADADPYTDGRDGIEFDHLMRDAIDDGADIISISIGGSGTIGYGDVVKEAHAEGVVIVVAAGSDGQAGVDHVAGRAGTVAVGAVDESAAAWDGQPAQERGTLIVSAPGVDIASGGMRGPARGASWVSNIEHTGTSLSAPIVAGMLALVKSKYPDATGNQLIQHLIHRVGGSDEGDTWAWSRPIGFGVASATRMLETDPTGWPDEHPLLHDTIDEVLEAYPPEIYGTDTSAAPGEDPAPAEDEAPQAAAETDSSTGALTLAAIAALVALLAAAVAALIVHRRRTRSSTSQEV